MDYEEINDYGCETCFNRVPLDEVHWIADYVGVCNECYEKIPEEILQCIEDEGGGEHLPDKVVDWLNKNLGSQLLYHKC